MGFLVYTWYCPYWGNDLLGHWSLWRLQEVIVQNFRAKKGTLMVDSPEPPLEELLWTVAMARLILGPHMNIQVLGFKVLDRVLGKLHWCWPMPRVPRNQRHNSTCCASRYEMQRLHEARKNLANNLGRLRSKFG